MDIEKTEEPQNETVYEHENETLTSESFSQKSNLMDEIKLSQILI